MISNGRGNNGFLIIFFGVIIVFQLISIAMRNFQANLGQIIGLLIGIAGYIIILYNSRKNKYNKKD